MKRIILSILALSFFLACNTQQENYPDYAAGKNNASLVLKNYKDTINYALGLVLAENMKDYGINDIDLNALNKGILDGLYSEKQLFSKEDAKRLVALYINQLLLEKKNVQLSENQKFLQENAKKKNITVLPSGLQYEVIESGSGLTPSLNDYVVVNYKGWTLDGKSLGNTFGKAPVRFRVNKAIKGWQEALTRMHEGDRWKLYIPPELAFANKQNTEINPNSIVIYEIELVKVEKNL